MSEGNSKPSFLAELMNKLPILYFNYILGLIVLVSGLRFLGSWDVAVFFNVLNQNLPLVALGLMFVKKKYKKLLNFNYILIGLMSFTFFYQLSHMHGLRDQIFGIYWQYHAFYLYAILILVFQVILRKKGLDNYSSFLVSFMMAKVVGLLYELPVYDRMNPYVGLWFHRTFPFLINGVFIVLGFLIYWFYTRTKIGKLTLSVFFLWLGFSIFYHYNPYVLSAFFPRLPTALFILTLCYSYKGKNQIQERVEG